MIRYLLDVFDLGGGASSGADRAVVSLTGELLQQLQTAYHGLTALREQRIDTNSMTLGAGGSVAFYNYQLLSELEDYYENREQELPDAAAGLPDDFVIPQSALIATRESEALLRFTAAGGCALWSTTSTDYHRAVVTETVALADLARLLTPTANLPDPAQYIVRTLYLSTSHVPAAQMAIATQQARAGVGPLAGLLTPDVAGWVIVVPDETHIRESWPKTELPEIRHVVRWAQQQGCRLIWLSSEGPLVTELFAVYP